MTPASTRPTNIGWKAGLTPLKQTLWIKLKEIIKRVLDTNACSGNQWSKDRYVIPCFYLSVISLHQEPVLPTALRRAREDAKRHGRSEESTKFGGVAPGLLHEDGTEIANTSVTPPGRLMMKFIDVGNKFMDPKDHMRRMKESQRRARIRSKNASKRHLR
jgi:hypothetical protein